MTEKGKKEGRRGREDGMERGRETGRKKGKEGGKRRRCVFFIRQKFYHSNLSTEIINLQVNMSY